MAKKTLITVDSKYRKAKKAFITDNGVYRKVKKAFITVGGVYRPCWSGGNLTYYGTATKLSTAKREHVAVSIGDYALFAGGYSTTSSSSYNATVAKYNSNLTRSTATSMSESRYGAVGASNKKYAIIGSGHTGSATTKKVDAYNTNAVKSVAPELPKAARYCAGASIGDYALIAGGYGTEYNYNISAYNSNLAKTDKGNYKAASFMAGASNGKYAIFAGGQDMSSGNALKAAIAVTADLVQSNPTDLGVAKMKLGGLSLGKYALFVGGYNNSSDGTKDVYAYDENLVQTIAPQLPTTWAAMATASMEDYGIVAGGSDGTYTIKTAVAYNSDLVQIDVADLSAARSGLAGTAVGDYALFAGGMSGSTMYQNVDAYVVA